MAVKNKLHHLYGGPLLTGGQSFLPNYSGKGIKWAKTCHWKRRNEDVVRLPRDWRDTLICSYGMCVRFVQNGQNEVADRVMERDGEN